MNIQLTSGSTKVFPVPYYPIGAVYMSYDSTSPAQMFGGTWEPITNRFLYGSTASGSVGGETTHTLTTSEMPAHTHTLTGRSGSGTSTSTTVIESYLTSATNTGSFNSTGGGKAHDNMPPYYAVYMWQRVEDDLAVAELDTAILDNSILG